MTTPHEDRTNDRIIKCACCEELTTESFLCLDCQRADCCMIRGARCGKF